MELLKNEPSGKYNVPLGHFDFDYIRGCSNLKELEKILKVLRSGDEGKYPELEQCCEERIKSINPESRVLRQDTPLLNVKDMDDKDQIKNIQDDITQWTSEMKIKEDRATEFHDENLPPIRGSSVISGNASSSKATEPAKRPVKPREYRDWDKIDVEKELDKIDLNEDKPKTNKNILRTSNVQSIPDSIDTSGLGEEQKFKLAEREKEKGNEAYKAGDLAEAIKYYTRSISVINNHASYNNRGLAYLKQKEYGKAMSDFDKVIQMEPENVKALIRRSNCYKEKKQLILARKDIETALKHNPESKHALKEKILIEEALAEQKVKGRKMVIEDIEGSSSDSEEENTSVIEKPNVSEENNFKTTAVSESSSNPEVKPEVKIENEVKAKLSRSKESKEQENMKNKEERELNTEVKERNQDNNEINIKKNEIQIKKMPKKVEDKKAIANDFFKRGQYDQAISNYSSGIDMLKNLKDDGYNFHLATLLSNRAQANIKIGDCSSAVKDCNLSLDIFPGLWKTVLRRASAYEAMEKYHEAYADYQLTLTMVPGNEMSLQASARCMRVLQDLHGNKWRQKIPKRLAMTLYEGPSSISNVETTKSKEIERLFNINKTKGNELVKKEKYKEAINYYSECIKISPESTPPYTNRALCYLKLGDSEKAKDDCSKALEYEKDNIKALYRRAQANDALKNYKSAKDDLTALLQLELNNKPAKILLQAISKKEEESKKEPGRHKIPIVESDSDESSDENETNVKIVKKKHEDIVKPRVRPSSDQESPAPSKEPISEKNMTNHNFMRILSEESGAEKLVNVLEQFEPQKLSKVVGNKLEGKALANLIKCVDLKFLKEGNCKQAFEYLKAIVRIPRFALNYKFLSKAEQAMIKCVVDKIESAQCCSGEELYNIKKFL
ncbi:DgyrCDS1770 [Dimorphilus gyrociliatus]|uniref:DgyrCDS1770 n=1 Tax=Dimorphilus gyrociliatus TaxID=2664684 RepID=A0A7I8V8E3_9ANNE|nr:DgyrCDS1770 [Dimorphilus gyrociliatus]